MCDSGGGDEKKRYLLGPFDMPDHPQQLMTLDNAIDDLRTWFDELDPGDEVHYRLVEMTDKEVEALPDL